MNTGPKGPTGGLTGGGRISTIPEEITRVRKEAMVQGKNPDIAEADYREKIKTADTRMKEVTRETISKPRPIGFSLIKEAVVSENSEVVGGVETKINDEDVETQKVAQAYIEELIKKKII